MESKILSHPAALCNMVRRIAHDAGEMILTHYDPSGCAHDIKDDGSPVTPADQEAEVYIEKALREILPDIPVVAEEAISAGKVMDTQIHPYFWLVDPLDGTREFVKGGEDFTVNIALIHQGTPVLGVIYAPALGEMFAGYGAGTAIRWNRETDTEKNIRVRKPPSAGLTVAISRFEGARPKLDQFLESLKVEKLVRRGSSLKICLVAMGKADLYPRFGRTCEWDTAAGDIILRSAGGTLTDMFGKALAYGGGGTWENPGFLAHAGVLDFTEALIP